MRDATLIGVGGGGLDVGGLIWVVGRSGLLSELVGLVGKEGSGGGWEPRWWIGGLVRVVGVVEGVGGVAVSRVDRLRRCLLPPPGSLNVSGGRRWWGQGGGNQ